MQLTEIIDEQGRYFDFYAEDLPSCGYVRQSSRYSYLFTREQLILLGDVMAFEFDTKYESRMRHEVE